MSTTGYAYASASLLSAIAFGDRVNVDDVYDGLRLSTFDDEVDLGDVYEKLAYELLVMEVS